jgi:hypothetical protein
MTPRSSASSAVARCAGPEALADEGCCRCAIDSSRLRRASEQQCLRHGTQCPAFTVPRGQAEPNSGSLSGVQPEAVRSISSVSFHTA